MVGTRILFRGSVMFTSIYLFMNKILILCQLLLMDSTLMMLEDFYPRVKIDRTRRASATMIDCTFN